MRCSWSGLTSQLYLALNLDSCTSTRYHPSRDRLHVRASTTSATALTTSATNIAPDNTSLLSQALSNLKLSPSSRRDLNADKSPILGFNDYQPQSQHLRSTASIRSIASICSVVSICSIVSAPAASTPTPAPMQDCSGLWPCP